MRRHLPPSAPSLDIDPGSAGARRSTPVLPQGWLVSRALFRRPQELDGRWSEFHTPHDLVVRGRHRPAGELGCNHAAQHQEEENAQYDYDL